jgi:molecular chaperone DnaK
MVTTHAVGIDLGTTYSCIAHLNEQGEPVSIPNHEGEVSTPSVVMFDRGEEIVGTEALRNAIMHPAHVIQNAKRFMGDAKKSWTIDGKTYTPIDVSAAVLRKLLRDAQQQIGPIERAVITVPAQFSEAQRLATVEAGRRAGLKHVEIINEPVAAALCYVLGTEGLWFTELADEQRILVYDLGGGTFDLSLVSYKQNEVRVIASTGDLYLGGIDWNQCLQNAVAEQFAKEFGEDPRQDPESLQHLAWEVEQCKRSLSVRPRAALIVQHAGHRKTYQIEREQFAGLTKHLLKRTEEITNQLLEQQRKGASHLDITVLSAGGSSRMPMIDEMLHTLRGTRVSKTLSPDHSIAHGATYYAGMLLSNSEFVHSILDADAKARLRKLKQQSVNARALGILIRDVKSRKRVPFYMIPANTPLPIAATKKFGTVVPNQKRVHLSIVESGAGAFLPYAELGTCTIEGLPPNLPVESEIAVTISYDTSARVHVSAQDVTSGKQATAEIHRGENVLMRELPEDDVEEITLSPVGEESVITLQPASVIQSAPLPIPAAKPEAVPPIVSSLLDPTLTDAGSSEIAVALCGKCGHMLEDDGTCSKCDAVRRAPAAPAPAKPGIQPVVPEKRLPPRTAKPAVKPAIKPAVKPVAKPAVKPAAGSGAGGKGPAQPAPEQIMELPVKKKPATPNVKPAPSVKPLPRPGKKPPRDPGEEEFWKLTEQ